MKPVGINRHDATRRGKLARGRKIHRDLTICKHVLIASPSGSRMSAPASYLAKEAALAQAGDADGARGEGALHGIPIAIKDIIDTHDMPTEHGSPIYKGAIPVLRCRLRGDAAASRRDHPRQDRHAGIRRGDARANRQPANLKHTPGGSSSGSAAAVADFMVPGRDRHANCRFDHPARPLIAAWSATCRRIRSAGARRQSAGRIARQSRHPDTLGCRRVRWSQMRSSDATRCARSRRRIAPRIGFCPSPHWPQAQDSTRGKSWKTRSRYCAARVRRRNGRIPCELRRCARCPLDNPRVRVRPRHGLRILRPRRQAQPEARRAC